MRIPARAEKACTLLRTHAVAAALTAIVVIFSIYIFDLQLGGDKSRYLSALPFHFDGTKQIMEGNIYVGHMGFHMMVIALHKLLGCSLAYSFIAILTLFQAISYLLIYRITQHFLRNDFTPALLACVAGAVFITASLYMPLFNVFIYTGQGISNHWLNPTYITMRPFALAAFLVCVRILDGATLPSFKSMALFAVLMAVTDVIKPNFTTTLIPALGLYLLVRRPGEYALYLRFALALLPTVLLIAAQYYVIFMQNPTYEVDRIIVSPFGVWGRISANPLISLLLAIAFPLCVTAFRFKNGIKTDLMLAWLNFAIAVILYAFFAEQKRFTHGNFAWGSNMGLHLLFVFSTIEWLRWMRDERCKTAATKIGFNALTFSSTLFLFHLFSGYLYLCRVAKGTTIPIQV